MQARDLVKDHHRAQFILEVSRPNINGACRVVFCTDDTDASGLGSQGMQSIYISAEAARKIRALLQIGVNAGRTP